MVYGYTVNTVIQEDCVRAIWCRCMRLQRREGAWGKREEEKKGEGGGRRKDESNELTTFAVERESCAFLARV